MSGWKKCIIALSWEKYSYYEDFFFLQKDIVNFPDYDIQQDYDPAVAPKADGKVCLNR